MTKVDRRVTSLLASVVLLSSSTLCPAADWQGGTGRVPPKVPTGRGPTTGRTTPGGGSRPSRAIEVSYWDSVDKSDAKELEAYLRKFPNGEFRDLANIKLAKFGKTVQFSAPATDTYGNVTFGDEMARLDALARALQEVPGAQAYLVAYGGRRDRAGEAQRRVDRAKNYLVNTRGVDPDRVVTVDGGFRENLEVELWIVPVGGTPPVATPTVDPSEVQGARPNRRRNN